MTWLTDMPGAGAAEERARKSLSLPIGAASPLWFAFGAAASAGVAWWWMTRWTRPANLEAAFAVLKTPARPPVLTLVTEAAEDVLEQAAEAVKDAMDDAVAAAEAVTDRLVEAIPEPAAAAEPVVEAAPEPEAVPEPVVEAAPEPLVPDDLTRLVGIGPKLAAGLAERGVVRFAQIAAWGEDDLALFDKALDLKGRAVRDAWVAQAARLA